MAGTEAKKRANIDEPRWDQSVFLGRLYHFFSLTDPRNALASEKTLDEAKTLVQLYRLGKEPPGTTEEQLWTAKSLYDSAFHPDTGEKQNVIGRMSFQVPGGMAITGCMLQFYKTTSSVIFWQWINQSFNALVNYTNRNAQSDITSKQIGIAYVSATTSALITAVGLKNILQKTATSLMQRWVPFIAVAAANCVNIPLMRQSELLEGISVFDENGNTVGKSKVAAAKGITQVVTSRIIMAAPGMLLCPVLMEHLEKFRWMQRAKFLHLPIQVTLVGCMLTAMVPVACSIFPQKCSMHVKTIERWEPDSFKEIASAGDVQYVYFNKGL